MAPSANRTPPYNTTPMRLLAAATLLTALAACSPTVPILQPQAQARLPDKWPQEWTKKTRERCGSKYGIDCLARLLP